MADRDDALVKAAEEILRIRDAALAIDGAVAAVGEIDVEPGAGNVIPARARLSVDARAPDRERLDALVAAIELAARTPSRADRDEQRAAPFSPRRLPPAASRRSSCLPVPGTTRASSPRQASTPAFCSSVASTAASVTHPTSSPPRRTSRSRLTSSPAPATPGEIARLAVVVVEVSKRAMRPTPRK